MAPLANEAPRTEPPANDTFVPFPSPLRDLGAEGARKTLVGITPPGLLQSIASAVGAKAASAPEPAPQAMPAARSVPPARAPNATIEGAPCKPIETNEEFGGGDFGAFDGSRRPANPTVPFPRPRAMPRTPTIPNFSPDETPDIGRASWHGTTTRTLRFVLTSPDHKPQRVAAALVCAAAALVIFAVGRSPIAGTAGIGQTTGSLSADDRPKPGSPLPQPSERELEPASGSDPSPEPVVRDNPGTPDRVGGSNDDSSTLDGADDTVPDDTALRQRELAPGLVLPSEGSGSTRPVSDVIQPDNGAKGKPAAAPAAPKAGVKKPTVPPPPPSLPNPERKNSSELDFGI